MKTQTDKEYAFVNVFWTTFPKNVKTEKVGNPKRDGEISRCGSPRAARQKYCVWKLLDYALKKSFGKSLDEFCPYRDENGKWRSDKVEFSLSHSGNVAAVAVGNLAVGVDVEKHSESRFNDRLAKRILSKKELVSYNRVLQNKSLRLAEFWTEKESVFKMLGGESSLFAIDVACHFTYCEHIDADGETYVLAAASSKKVVPCVIRVDDCF